MSASIKSVARVVAVTALLLLVPLLAMQFSDEVDWGLTDFVTVGVLLLGAGFIYEFVVRKLRNPTHRVVAGVVLVLALLLIWVELAVGLFGTPFSGS